MHLDRRAAFRAAGLTAGLLATGAPAAAASGDRPLTDYEFAALTGSVPTGRVGVELAYEAVVDIAPARELGDGPWGVRRMVPITGGRFAGPRIGGTVLPGGADRQVLRGDGVRMLEAVYDLETDDGAVLTVVNNVVIDRNDDGSRYARSWLAVTAPIGPHDWLSRRVLVGTLDSLRPRRDAVLVRVFALT